MIKGQIRTSFNTQANYDKLETFIRPWEELQLKRNRYGLGYEKKHDNFLLIPKYSKPITFVSSVFLDDTGKKKKLEDNDQ